MRTGVVVLASAVRMKPCGYCIWRPLNSAYCSYLKPAYAVALQAWVISGDSYFSKGIFLKIQEVMYAYKARVIDSFIKLCTKCCFFQMP